MKEVRDLASALLRNVNERGYHCCNYCKYYVPDPIGDPFGDQAGFCHYDGKLKQDIMTSKYLKFYNWGCVIGYQHTIHNHYNLPYPQYANDYARSIKIRDNLMWDIYREKHRAKDAAEAEAKKYLPFQTIF